MPLQTQLSYLVYDESYKVRLWLNGDTGIILDPALTIKKKIVKDMTRAEVEDAASAPWHVDISTSSSSPSQTWYYTGYYDGTIPASATTSSKTYSSKLVFKTIESIVMSRILRKNWDFIR